MNDDEITVVGQTNFRGQQRTFGIHPDDRRRHLYIIGKTGVGKTTLMSNMIRQDIVSGKGVALVDPHGDICEELLDAIPPERINDVIYFNPADVDFPIAFNVLEAVDPKYKYLISSGLIGSLKKIWADSWGPRLEYILRNTILALLDYPSSTMLGILRMLGDNDYRKKVTAHIEDPVVKAFWTNEFANYNERFRSEAVSPIQNKVGQFLTSSVIRNIVAQPKSTIDMKDIMNNRKILLMNVSKGRIGEDNSSLLGAMLIARLQLAAMDRAHIPEKERLDFYLYVDEFQNFATESFATILSEARKYRLNLTLAHQYIEQMEEEVRDAVFGNAGTIVSFRVGAADAEFLEKEFAPVFMETDLVNLDKYNAYIKLMINGMTSRPFSMQTIEPANESFGNAQTVIEISRERYAHPREVVEDKVARWSGAVLDTTAGGSEGSGRGQPQSRDRGPRQHDSRGRTSRDQNQRAQGSSARRRESKPSRERLDLPPPSEGETKLADATELFSSEEITDLASLLGPRTSSPTSKSDVKCARCGKDTEVPFVPSADKPAYCKDCFADVREEQKKSRRQLGSPETTDAQPVGRDAASSPSADWSGPKPPSTRK